jgi:phytoene dehydrogenase-like protein
VADAVVVGAGPNGLVAANLLAEHGWEVVVLEAAAEPGGAVRDAEMAPGCRYDLFSGFYPLGAASPVMARLDLERWGVRWRQAPVVIGHPFLDGRSAILSMDIDATCESLDSFGAGQGDRWRSLFGRWQEVRGPLLQSLLGAPFPPVVGPARLVKTLGLPELLAFARFAVLPLRRMCDEEDLLDGAAMLLGGNAAHSDLTPDLPLSGFFGWLLAMLGQDVGFPVPEGGSGQLTAALVRRLESLGGRVVCNARVARVEIKGGRACAVMTEDGGRWPAKRAVVADVVAPILFRDLVGVDHLPARLVTDLTRFQLDNSTFKVDWLLAGVPQWRAPRIAEAGTIHIAESLSEVATTGLQLADRMIPDQPFVVVGQSSVADPTRTPDERAVMWAYTHVPQRPRGDAGGALTGAWTKDDCERMADRVEARIEAHAPGFRSTIRTRRILSPADLETRDSNLLGGAINGGTSALHQQLVFRPVPGLGRPHTPIKGLYLGSSSAHPGGGVHGACGANAARAALAAHRVRRAIPAAAAGMAAAATIGGRR